MYKLTGYKRYRMAGTEVAWHIFPWESVGGRSKSWDQRVTFYGRHGHTSDWLTRKASSLQKPASIISKGFFCIDWTWTSNWKTTAKMRCVCVCVLNIYTEATIWRAVTSYKGYVTSMQQQHSTVTNTTCFNACFNVYFIILTSLHVSSCSLSPFIKQKCYEVTDMARIVMR